MSNINHQSKRIWRNIGLLSALAFIIGVMEGCASKAPTKPEALELEAAFGEKVIYEIAVAEEATQTLVVIKGNEPLPYTSVKHLLPLGVVLYFPKTSLKGVQETYTPESALIKSIVTTELRGRGGYSRIQINLKEDVSYKAAQEENQLLVYLRKPIAERTEGTETAAAAPKETKEPTVPEPEKGIEVEETREAMAEGAEPEGTAPVSAEAEKVGKPAFVNRIDFVMLKDRKSRVIVGTTNRVRFETTKPSDKRLLLKLFNTKIPKFQKRPLITTRFKSAVDRVVPVQTAKMGDTAVIAIQLRETVPYRVEQKENVLVVDLEPSSVPPTPMPEAERPEWVQVMKEAETEIVKAETEIVKAETEIVKEAEAPPELLRRFTGQKISLDFQDADIRHVFRILHEVSGKNFVIGDDVKGKITLKLDNVPWDQVLWLILKTNRLGTLVEGNIVRIQTLKAIEQDQTDRGRVKALEPLVSDYIPVNYAGASAISTHLDGVLSDRGKVTIDERTNMIVIRDIPTHIYKVRELVKRLDVVTPQVMIEARIVEANTDFSRELGVLWGGTYDGVSGDGTYQLGGGLGTLGAANNWAVNLPPAAPTSGIGFNFERLIGSNPLRLDANLQAMESEGKGKIISSPRVLTLDNKKAYIEQGVTIPYQVLEEGSYSLKWASAVLKLEVTPHITMDRRIAMKILAKKDAPDWSRTVAGAPAINTKVTETELLVNDGDTIVIGGIIIKEETLSRKGVPGLSKIPLLGWLFRSQSKIEGERELLIFVTPTIVKLEEARLTVEVQESNP